MVVTCGHRKSEPSVVRSREVTSRVGTVGARRRNMLHGRGSERSVLTSAAQRLEQVRTESGLRSAEVIVRQCTTAGQRVSGRKDWTTEQLLRK